MWWLLAFLFLLPFSIVPFLGAPYVPSKVKPFLAILKKVGVKKGEMLVDLGSGDGAILQASAKQYPMRVYGVELNPFLVFFSRFRLRRFGERARVDYGNLWTTAIPVDADYIYAFIMPKHMAKLDEKISSEITKPVTVITYSFEFPERTPDISHAGYHAYRFVPLAKSK